MRHRQAVGHILKSAKGVGEVAEQPRALVALPEEPGLIPSTPHDGSQPSVAPVPGAPIPSSVLHGHQKYICMWCTDRH